MLWDRQHSEKDQCVTMPPDLRFPVLAAMIDGLDLDCFIRDPGYRRQLTEVLDALSDEEFDRFELLYTRRFTLN
jgi:hypothetical protein